MLKFGNAAIFAALVLLAQPVRAATIVATWSGTITQGLDGTGYFGTANSDLAGDAFEAVFTYDTNLGALVSATGGRALAGGSLTGYVPDAEFSSPGTATLTIDGVTHDFTGSHGSSFAAIQPYSGATLQSTFVGDSFSFVTGRDYISILTVNDPTLTPSLSTNYSGAACTISCEGYFELPGAPLTFGYLAPDFYQLTVDGVFVEPPSGRPFGPPLPEPTTWLLMLLGFFGLGYTLRGQRDLRLR
jgi:hypothetical protein